MNDVVALPWSSLADRCLRYRAVAPEPGELTDQALLVRACVAVTGDELGIILVELDPFGEQVLVLSSEPPQPEATAGKIRSKPGDVLDQSSSSATIDARIRTHDVVREGRTNQARLLVKPSSGDGNDAATSRRSTKNLACRVKHALTSLESAHDGIRARSR